MEFLPLIGKVRMGFKQSEPHPSPLFRPLPQYLLNFKIFEQEFPKERESNFPKRTYSPIDLFTSSLKKKHAAFTLAEVLITLGIIGVVAVLTLSTVIQNIQNKQNIAKWKKEYSVINNAFNEVVADGITICNHSQYGNCFGNSYTNDFLYAIQSKLRVADYCGSTTLFSSDKRCDFSQSDYWKKHGKYKWSGVNVTPYCGYKALGGGKLENSNSPYGINAYNFNKMALLLADGAAVYFGESHYGPWMVVDVNNFNKGPNEFGRDVFVIHVTSNIKTNKHYIQPMGANGTYNFYNDSNYDECGCSKDEGVKTANYIAGAAGTANVISGACCSAIYLLE